MTGIAACSPCARVVDLSTAQAPRTLAAKRAVIKHGSKTRNFGSSETVCFQRGKACHYQNLNAQVKVS